MHPKASAVMTDSQDTGSAKVDRQKVQILQGENDRVERALFIAAIRQGLEEAELGLGQPAEQVFAELAKQHGL